MATYTFANLDQWALKTERRIDAVVKDSTQSVVNVMQTPKAKGGRMPVDTGNLRNSLMSSLTGGAGQMGPASHIMVAASMKGGDTATFTYTAEYAKPVNNGRNGRPGAHFVEGAVDMWPALVRASVAKAKAAVR
jgi:hypothetical protein